MGKLEYLKSEILRSKIEFAKSMSKINGDKPYFDTKWLLENMMGIKKIYCPSCLKVCEEYKEYNDNTLATHQLVAEIVEVMVECPCKWTGNMSDLLTEKEMTKELRRRKIDNINKL